MANMNAGVQAEHKSNSTEEDQTFGNVQGEEAVRDGQDELLRDIFYSPTAESGDTTTRRSPRCSPTTTEEVQYSFESSLDNEEGTDDRVVGAAADTQTTSADGIQEETETAEGVGNLEAAEQGDHEENTEENMTTEDGGGAPSPWGWR